jgi:5-formyltetrahydrofolate cyclo-ligase
VVLIPGLAYTRSLERLGRGKAYFDNYLKNYKGEKIGLFFGLQEVDDVFLEKHDMKLDLIITEKEIIRGNK